MLDKRYPSDLTDEEWEVVKAFLQHEKDVLTRRPIEVDLRRVWDAILYLNKTGCQWAYLPHDFPPPTTVNYHYLKWMKTGFFEQVNTEVRKALRKKTVEMKTQVRGLSTVKVSQELLNRRKNPALMGVNTSKVESGIL